jgi:hypothetical protein
VADTKYGKYLVKEPVRQWKWFKGLNFFSEENNSDMNFSIQWNTVAEPFRLPDEPHSHDFDEVWIFLGTTVENCLDLGGEIELYLGEELEKHIITNTTIVQIPKGLMHCPLIFTRVDKPIHFINIPLTPHYAKKEMKKEK